MRRGNNPQILILDGKFLGFDLSSDFCAEHEWGIKRIDNIWKRNPETHKLTAYPELDNDLKLVVAKGGEVAMLYYAANRYKDGKFPENDCNPKELLSFNRELFLLEAEKNPRFKPSDNDLIRQRLATAWSEYDFAILVKDKDLVDMLTKLYEALKIGDAAIWLGGGHAFENAGFCVAIYSNLPSEVTQKWKDHYEDCKKLKKASNDSGIEEKLKKAGKKWFCLEPKWIDGFKPQGKTPISKYPIIYWLNPQEQNIHNFGWFTVENLELWAEDKGPVMMTKEQIEKR